MPAAPADGRQFAFPNEFSDTFVSRSDHPSGFLIIDDKRLSALVREHLLDEGLDLRRERYQELLDELLLEDATSAALRGAFLGPRGPRVLESNSLAHESDSFPLWDASERVGAAGVFWDAIRDRRWNL
jgi:hypothetical protein